MTKLMTLCLTATLALFACSAPNTFLAQSPNQPSQSQLNTRSTGVIKGSLVLPYRVQMPSKLSMSTQAVMAYILGQPAQAQESSSDTESSGPLSAAELENLTATVDGQPVELTVTEVTPSPTSEETVVTYQIDQAPVGAGNEVVEIQTATGESVGGAVIDAEPNTTTVAEITPASTALLETAAEIHGSMKIADLTEADLEALELDPAVLNKQASLRSILRKDGTLKPNKARQFKQKTPSPSPSPSSSSSAAPSASPSASASASPSESASPAASPSPLASPAESPSASPSVSAENTEASTTLRSTENTGNGKGNGKGKNK